MQVDALFLTVSQLMNHQILVKFQKIKIENFLRRRPETVKRNLKKVETPKILWFDLENLFRANLCKNLTSKNFVSLCFTLSGRVVRLATAAPW